MNPRFVVSLDDAHRHAGQVKLSRDLEARVPIEDDVVRGDLHGREDAVGGDVTA